MIKILYMDVDGTLTDGKIYMGESGELCKVFDIKDGCGIHDILPKHDIVPVIITARESSIVRNRCKELGIYEAHQGCRNKRQKMLEVAAQYGIVLNSDNVLEQAAYIGDDISDLQCMEIAQYKGAPSDAVDEVKAIVDFVSSKAGGNGAVREFIEWLLRI